MTKEVNVIITGGLGNQLFQYAAAKQVAKILNTDNIKIYLTGYHLPKSHPRIYNLIKNLNFTYIPKGNSFLKKVKRFLLYRYKRQIIEEKTPYWIPISKFKFKKSRISLFGQFQHISWCENVLDQIFSEIKNFEPANIEILKNKKLNTLSFRRNDYTQEGWDLKIDYYLKSLKKLSINPGEELTLVGDELSFLDWVAEIFKAKGYLINKEKNNFGISDFLHDFFIIGYSHKVILANSTFAWWAGVYRKINGLNFSNVCSPKTCFPPYYFKNLHKALYG